MDIKNQMQFRVEKDSIGTKQVPYDAYYGVQSLRGAENFPNITGQRIHPELIRALAYIKKAAAIANNKADIISNSKCIAITRACDEILAGKFHEEFIVDAIQGGAGTSMNMNANEVIANRAIEIMGGAKGEYTVVHPNDDVNCGQSTNDVIPTAGKIATLHLLNALLNELHTLHDALASKAEEFDKVLKMGRTQMQDAVPIRLGQEFLAYANAVKRGTQRIESVMWEMKTVNMGGTAIGTGINADEQYFKTVVPILAEVTGLDLVQADDLIDATQHIDGFVAISGAVKACAMALSKIANDLRLMSSGPKTGFGEINLPPRQNGSSIMPGKVNPVIPEVLTQAAFLVAGNDVTINMAAEAGQLELNAFEPVTFYCLFESLTAMISSIHTFTVNCVDGIVANEERCRQLLESSVGVVTALVPHIGYQHAADIAKKSLKTGAPVRWLVLEEKHLFEDELNEILEPMNLTTPGIAGKEVLIRNREKYK